MDEPVKKTENEWRKALTPEEYRVIRQKETEKAFSGQYLHDQDKGMYRCRACGAELFASDTKFDSGTGWPSFTEPVSRKNVELKDDFSHVMHRTEVLCKRCGAHLGHVFDDGPRELNGRPASGKRFCINSVSLKLDKQKE